MQKHTKIYMDYFDYSGFEYMPCEICTKPANQVHHIKYRSRGGKDEIKNLMGLCFECHTSAHSEFYSESMLRAIHLKFMERGGVKNGR